MENIVRAMACARCPLQGMPGLRELDETQIAYMQDFKDGEIQLEKGQILVEQSEALEHLYTLMEGVLAASDPSPLYKTKNQLFEKDLQFFEMGREPLSRSHIIPMSPPRPPLPSKRLVIRSRKAFAHKERRPFFCFACLSGARSGTIGEAAVARSTISVALGSGLDFDAVSYGSYLRAARRREIRPRRFDWVRTSTSSFGS